MRILFPRCSRAYRSNALFKPASSLSGSHVSSHSTFAILRPEGSILRATIRRYFHRSPGSGLSCSMPGSNSSVAIPDPYSSKSDATDGGLAQIVPPSLRYRSFKRVRRFSGDEPSSPSSMPLHGDAEVFASERFSSNICGSISGYDEKGRICWIPTGQSDISERPTALDVSYEASKNDAPV
jgi:hypothetical protein